MSLKLISEKSGFSISTVSKVLNNKADNIPDTTKNKILKVAEEHNYTPYKKIFDKVVLRYKIVAVIVTDISNLFSAQLIQGIEDFFYSKNYSVIVCNTEGNYEKEKRYLEDLKEKNIQGIISYRSPDLDNNIVDDIINSDIHFVLLDNYYVNDNYYKTYFDNEEGAFLATEYLINHNHKKIGYITKSTKYAYLNARLNGYKKALEKYKLDYNENLVYFLDNKDYTSKDLGYFGTKYLISQGITSIFCCDDEVAVGTYKAIEEAGLKIPYDISVVGFDNSIISELLTPSLATIDQPAREIGYKSANMLFNIITNNDIDNEIIIKPKLIENQSVTTYNECLEQVKEGFLVIGSLHWITALDITNNENITNIKEDVGGSVIDFLEEVDKDINKCYVISNVGNDKKGTEIYKKLFNLGVKVDGITFDEKNNTGKAFLHNYGNKEDIYIQEGANENIVKETILKYSWIFEKVKYCVVSYKVAKTVFDVIYDLCIENSVKIILQIETKEDIKNLSNYQIDFCICNEHFKEIGQIKKVITKKDITNIL